MGLIVGLIIGLLVGAIFSWFIRKYKFESEKGIEITEHQKVINELNDVKTLKSVAEEKTFGLEKQLSESKEELGKERSTSINLKEQLSESNANYKNLEEKLITQKQELEEIQKKLTAEFENLANRILEEKSAKFTKQNQVNIEGLLKPLSDKITDFKKKVEDVYTDETKERSQLKGELSKLFDLNQQMALEAKNLTNALKGETKIQGNWGELILKRVLEISGLVEGREFKTQGSFTSDEGKRQQPDVILYLPDNKHMIIDSKVSLSAYEKYYSSEDELLKQKYLKEHVASIKNHVKLLSEKKYQNIYQLDAPDFVLMFLAIDPAFGLALQSDPLIYSEAFEKNVIIVSPLSLLATLKTLSSVWKRDYQNKNVIEIARQGGALYDKFVGFVEDMKTIGNRINQTQDSYNEAMNKLSKGTGNLITKVENVRKLGIKTQKIMPKDLLLEENDSEE